MGKKVMVVDDEKEIVDFLERFLIRFNLSVIKATGGLEAFDFFKQHRPELVFLDIKMPDKDGLVLLQELIEIDQRLKVIMITGRDEEEIRDKAKSMGALDYITKPLDLTELGGKVKKYILA